MRSTFLNKISVRFLQLLMNLLLIYAQVDMQTQWLWRREIA